MRFTAIIPTYEEPRKTLKRTVDQFLKYKHVEVIISDSSVNRVPKEHWFKKKTTIVYSTKTNISTGRNIGADHATNEIIMFLDADVTLPYINQWLRCIKRELATNKHNNCIVPKMSIDPKYKQPYDDINCKFTNFIQMINGCGRGECIITRKSVFDKVGQFDTSKNVGEDWDLAFRLKPVVYPDLYYMESGRRFHAIGWSRMHYEWALNSLFPKDRTWEPIGR